MNGTHTCLDIGAPAGVALRRFFSGDECCRQSSHDLRGVRHGVSVELLLLHMLEEDVGGVGDREALEVDGGVGNWAALEVDGGVGNRPAVVVDGGAA